MSLELADRRDRLLLALEWMLCRGARAAPKWLNLRPRCLYWAARCIPRFGGERRGRLAKIGHGGHLLIDIDDDEGRRIYVAAEYEPDMTEFAMAVLRDGDLVIDVGANIGAHSVLFASLIGENGHVHAFEPNPAPAAQLRSSISLNGWHRRISLHQQALAESDGTALLSIGDKSGTTSSLLELPWLARSRRIDVSITTLDTFASLLPQRPRLLKLDVEGAEPLVIGGGLNNFFRHSAPSYLAVEFWNRGNPSELLATITSLGYEPVTLARRLLPPDIGNSPTEDSLHDATFQYSNLFFQYAPPTTRSPRDAE